MKCYKLTVMYWALLCAGNKSEERQHCAHDKPADKAARKHRMGLCRYQLTSLHAHDVVLNKSEEGLRRALHSDRRNLLPTCWRPQGGHTCMPVSFVEAALFHAH